MVGRGLPSAGSRIEQRGPIRAWIVDDTGFPKKGKHSGASVPVLRPVGQAGQLSDCVSRSIANDAASLLIAYEPAKAEGVAPGVILATPDMAPTAVSARACPSSI